MYNKSIFIIVITVLILGCSELMLVKTRFINIDSDEEFMNLRFDFFSHKDSSKSAYVDIIEIYHLDKLLVKMIGDTFITSYLYPSIPDGFTITYPENNKELPILDKDNNYRFSFSGKVRYNAYCSWEYYALYSKKEGRWLFNERQIYSAYIKAKYESWVGNDIIMITLTNKIRIDDSTFYLTNECGERIKCEPKIKRIPTDKIALTLSEDQKPGKIIILNISNSIINKENGNGHYLKYPLIVPKSSSIGLIGKYGRL